MGASAAQAFASLDESLKQMLHLARRPLASCVSRIFGSANLNFALSLETEAQRRQAQGHVLRIPTVACAIYEQARTQGLLDPLWCLRVQAEIRAHLLKD